MAGGKPKTLNGKELKGILLEPIETGCVMPIGGTDEQWREFIVRHAQALGMARYGKIDALAEHLDIDRDLVGTVAASAEAREFYLLQIIFRLAGATVPGFQEVPKGKWPRDIVWPIMIQIDQMKDAGKIANDLEGCESYLRMEHKKLGKRASSRTELRERAKTLRNRISDERTALRDAKTALSQNNADRIVKH